ncbi:phosphoribosylamine--glycine ligase [Rhizobium sp. L1K21]|uniref:phosphoribosylamine--glycine ligase n=1 Tax=Rhizobium sp. L1K21 TaxID=2954933 RepID=UPI002093D998|nr:phosphoribosylamine--glycine ligase [Rhizobium sp. L1K21]MCO6186902.1 phosphoribosylamine--glycine ligase [Rhizobium sp. L1K21]
MNVLLIGSGGREHALAWKMAQSPLLSTLYIAPGNAGMHDCGTLVSLDVDNHDAVIAFCNEKAVTFVIVGPEAPLVAGIADDLRAAGIKVFGPSAAAAQLEGSKGFTKDLCAKYNIPTGAYQRFNNAPKAKAYVRQQGVPIVIKADGLAAGKGVTVAMTLDEALNAIDDCFEGAYGEAGAEVVVEAYLDGEEASFFCISDGKNLLALASAQDHKRVGDGDTGPNTGGMGAYSPAPVMTEAMVTRTMKEIIEPTVAGMAADGHPFSGVFFAGLMITEKGPELIEYNVRFGDPECQVLMMRLKSDLLEILLAAAEGRLNEVTAEWRDETALTVVMASKGYPGSYEKNTVIAALPESVDGTKIFHAGTALKDGQLVATGGRVLNVTATGASVMEAQTRAYAAVDAVQWENGFCRRDIGWRAIEREKA